MSEIFCRLSVLKKDALFVHLLNGGLERRVTIPPTFTIYDEVWEVESKIENDKQMKLVLYNTRGLVNSTPDQLISHGVFNT
jgi:hypothetical protein